MLDLRAQRERQPSVGSALQANATTAAALEKQNARHMQSV